MQRRSTKLSGCKHSPSAAHWRLAHTFSLPPPPDTSTGYRYPVLTYNAARACIDPGAFFTAGCHDGRLSAGPRTAAQSGETHRSMENCKQTVCILYRPGHVPGSPKHLTTTHSSLHWSAWL
ncbi:unnamed protein product [Arctogadus glacialis]